MASWHQDRDRNPVKRWHTTKWSVWDDPPGQPAGAYLVDTEEQAIGLKAKLKANGREYVYIYAPAPNGR